MMLLPGMLFILVYNISPILGSVIAFQDYKPTKGILGSEWVGLENFIYMFQLPDIKQVFCNTIFIACMKIIFTILASLVFAVLLNELQAKFFKKGVQTIVYLPHFLSWVILAGIFRELLSGDGLINQILISLHVVSEPILFLSSSTWFPFAMIFSDVWKEFGFNAVIFLAALMGIEQALNEAAYVDGATRVQRIRHVTLPGIASTVVLVATLNIGNALNAGFDQIFNMYNPTVYATGDIIDTYVYRAGLLNYQFSFATAVGLMKSVITFGLMVTAYKLADKYANYRIF